MAACSNQSLALTSEVPTILGLLAITLLQINSSMRDYKMLEGRIRCSAEGAGTEGRCSEAEDHFSKVMVT